MQTEFTFFLIGAGLSLIYTVANNVFCARRVINSGVAWALTVPMARRIQMEFSYHAIICMAVSAFLVMLVRGYTVRNCAILGALYGVYSWFFYTPLMKACQEILHGIVVGTE